MPNMSASLKSNASRRAPRQPDVAAGMNQMTKPGLSACNLGSNMPLMRPFLLLLCAAPLLCAGTPSRAGFFDFFFQGGAPQQREMLPRGPFEGPFEAPPRPPAERHRHVGIVHRPAHEAYNPQREGLAKDPTLREGDAVMTKAGIRVVASSDEHGTRELVPLADTKGLSPAEFKALAAINANPADAGWDSELAQKAPPLTGRSSVANKSPAWIWVRGAAGQMIRYVGP
jgi:hypothetical protein